MAAASFTDLVWRHSVESRNIARRTACTPSAGADMTRRNNARLAGFSYLLYIAVAFPSMMLLGRATAGAGMPAKLASLAQHGGDVRLAAVLTLFGCFCALALAVSLWS